MTKTHYTQSEKPATAYSRWMAPTVCGRDAISTSDLRAVSCANCKRKPEYTEAVTAAGVAAAEAFANQTPRPVRNPWGNGYITCKCGGHEFRDNGRSLDHNRHVCAECGETTLTLTETGMSA